MNREYQDFCAGILVGILILCVILAVLRIVNWKPKYAVYENKMDKHGIEYRMSNPKEGGTK